MELTENWHQLHFAFSNVMENSHRKISLLPLIASRNFIPRVICANFASNQSCTIYSRKICRLQETANPSEGFTEEKLWAFNTSQWDHELIKRNEKTKTDIGNFLVVKHVKNTCLPTKLLSHVADNCMNTSPRLMRKYARIFFCRHYADIFCLYPNSCRIFKPCEKITFIFNKAAKKTN